MWNRTCHLVSLGREPNLEKRPMDLDHSNSYLRSLCCSQETHPSPSTDLPNYRYTISANHFVLQKQKCIFWGHTEKKTFIALSGSVMYFGQISIEFLSCTLCQNHWILYIISPEIKASGEIDVHLMKQCILWLFRIHILLDTAHVMLIK